MTDDPDPSKRTKYYVHYHGLNRRMDEWVGADRVTKPPSVAKAQGANEANKPDQVTNDSNRVISPAAINVCRNKISPQFSLSAAVCM